MNALSGYRVVDLAFGIPGAYCTKLLADAGADVVKVESVRGDPLRRWSVGEPDLEGRDGALFRFLHHGKRSVVGTADEPDIDTLIASADLVVVGSADRSGESDCYGKVVEWRDRDPGLVVVSISPFGRSGPYEYRPATHFTIEAEAGSLAMRSRPGIEPFQAGGRIAYWVAGAYAAVAALACARRARRTGHGETVDLSIHEVMTISGSLFMDMMSSLLGRPDWPSPAGTLETPSIEPTADGWIGFNTNTRQQWEDFCVLIGRPDLLAEADFASAAGRTARWDEWNEIVHAATRRRTTEDLLEQAGALRIPVAPIGTGESVVRLPHFVERGVFLEAPGGDFVMPRPPYLVDGNRAEPPGSSPSLGEHTDRVEARPVQRAARSGSPRPALAGLQVVDFTNWWAGPAATHMLGVLGADVLKIESIQRPDGMRYATVHGPATDSWWEYGFMFLSANANKRGITLDLGSEEGRAAVLQLIARADVVMENYSPRVMERFGLDWDTVHAANPQAVMVRMPAFGLDGPWRDHVGFAQTMEQVTGMAWTTGHLDDQPRIPRGPCDPNAGMHAVFALLAALEERDRSGRGSFVEAPMIESALNVAAEQVIEYSAYGHVMARRGNRSPEAAPQGLYRCSGDGDGALLALSVETDAHWQGLRVALGDPPWADDSRLATRTGRTGAHDELDAHIENWCQGRSVALAVEHLVSHGVPAAGLTDTRATSLHPQHRARGFYEELEHPVVGRHEHPSAPFRFESVDHWLEFSAPTLGQHNRDVLTELGFSEEDTMRMEATGVIGTRPLGA